MDSHVDEQPAIAQLRVTAIWDAEASVWVATSADVPGLVAEAASSDDLIRKLKVLIPELLEANGVVEPGCMPEIPFSLLAECRTAAQQ